MHVNKSTFEVLRENFLGSESMLTAVGQDSGRVARTGAPSQTLFTNIISEKRNLGKKLDTWYRQHNNAMVQMNRDQRPLYVSLMKTATKRKKLEVERERRRQERARQLAKELPPIVESGANSDVLDLTKKTATQPSHNNDGKAQPATLVVEGHIGQDFIGTENNPENPENSPGSPFLDVPDSFNRGRRKSSVQEETASLLSSLQKTYDIQPSSGEDVLKKDDSKVHKQDKEGTNDTKKKKRNRNKKERTSKKTLPPLDDRLQDENMSLNSKLSEDDDSSVSERTTVDGRPQTTDEQENILPSLPSDDVIDVVTASNDPESRLDDKNDNSENRTSSSVENTKERQKESKKKKDKDKDQGKQSRKNSTGAKHLHVPHGSVCGSSSTGSLLRKKKKKRQDNYEVTVYKKEANGDLTPEQKQISTKVDIYDYFKVPQRRERLTRQKLLEDVRKKEQQQREKVSSFLKKIDEEDNQQPVIVVERQDDDSGGGLLMRQSKRLLAPTPRDTLTAQMNEMEKIRTHCRYVRIYHRPSELQDWQRKGPRLTSWAPNAKDAL